MTDHKQEFSNRLTSVGDRAATSKGAKRNFRGCPSQWQGYVVTLVPTADNAPLHIPNVSTY
jgi:hypothetical protein